MKKLTILLISLFTFLTVFAGEVTEQQALLIAQKFVQGKQFKQKNLRRAPLENVENKAYYVFNVENNSGFVIVAGNDHMPEILGYSERGNFDLSNAPSNVRWWLSQYEKAASTLTGQTPKAAPRRTEEAKAGIPPFITTTWGQGYPYNTQCPQIDGTNCQTGCVATAMAQVMNYTRCPKGETGEIAAYTTKTNGLSLTKLDATTFPWDSMTNDDIARLMRYCGQSVSMDYGISESSANDVRIPGALVGKFGYDKAIRLVYRNGYNSETWENMIYAELQAGRPVIYGGQSNTGGHSFILHGYQDGRFYINWGWDGFYDGYFELSALNPMYDNDRTYGRDQTAIIGIQKSTGGDAANTPKVTVTKLELTSEASITRTSSSDNFTGISLEATLMNSFADEQTAQIGYALYLGDEWKQVISSENASFTPAVALTSTATLSFGSALADGTYRIVPVYREDESSEWVADEGSNYRYIEAVVNNDKMEMIVHPIGIEDERLVFEIVNENEVCVHALNNNIYGDIIIPEEVEIDGKSYIVTDIGGQYYTANDFGSGFEKCKISSIKLPATIRYIGANCFSRCTELKEIRLPKSFLAGGRYTPSHPIYFSIMSGCSSLTNIIVEEGNEDFKVEDGALMSKDGKYLCDYAGGLDTKDYVIPESVEELEQTVFAYNSKIESVKFSPNIKYVPSTAFREAKALKTVYLPDSLEIIEQMAFFRSSIESIELPNSLYKIEMSAFDECNNLKEIVLPASLNSIGDYAFSACNNLMKVTVKQGNPLSIKYVFGSETTQNGVLYVPTGRAKYYREATGWCEFQHIEEIDMPDVIISSDPFDNIEDNQVIFGHYNDNNKMNPEEGGYGIESAGKCKACIGFNKKHLIPYDNSMIKGVRFALVNTDIKDVKIWASTALGKQDLFIQDVNDLVVGWNPVILKEPICINAEKELYIGLEYVSEKSYNYPLSAIFSWYRYEKGSFYICNSHSSDEDEWNDLCGEGDNGGQALSLQCLIERDNLPEYDIHMIDNSLYYYPKYMKIGSEDKWDTSVSLRNWGKKDIGYDYDLCWNINNKLINIPVEAYLNQKANLQTTNKEGYSLRERDVPEGLKPGKNSLRCYVNNIKGEKPQYMADDTLCTTFYTYSKDIGRQKVLVHNFTSTWCPNAVWTSKYLDDMIKDDPNVVLLTLHATDELSCEAGNEYYRFSSLVGTYGFNRYYSQNYYMHMAQNLETVRSMPSFADVHITSSYDQKKRILNIVVKGERNEEFVPIHGYTNLTVLLTEDDVIAPQYDGDNGIYIDDYHHKGVLRTNVSAIWGDPVIWDGDKYEMNYSIKLNETWDKDNMHIVAFLGKPFDGSNYDDIDIMNCNDFAVKDAEIIESLIIPGDVTGSGTVDVQDATLTVNYILGEESDEYNYDAADVNRDGEVDVFDVTQIINIILSNGSSASRRMGIRSSMEDVMIVSDGGDIVMGVSNVERFTSFQFDVVVPQNIDLLGVDWNGAANHILQFAKIRENRYTVVGLSMESEPLPNLGNGLLRLRLSGTGNGEVSFSNVLFVTPQGKAAHFNDSSLNMTTGVKGVTYIQGELVRDISGRQINMKREQLPKGVYVINNKKVVIK